MQTFLPYADLRRSARCLDSSRLLAQRNEATRILDVLLSRQICAANGVDPVGNVGYANHPAVLAWRDCSDGLTAYALEIAIECSRRGIADSLGVLPNLRTQCAKAGLLGADHGAQYTPTDDLPWWFGCQTYHRAHRLALAAKDPVHHRHHFHLPPLSGVADVPRLAWPVHADEYEFIATPAHAAWSVRLNRYATPRTISGPCSRCKEGFLLDDRTGRHGTPAIWILEKKASDGSATT